MVCLPLGRGHAGGVHRGAVLRRLERCVRRAGRRPLPHGGAGAAEEAPLGGDGEAEDGPLGFHRRHSAAAGRQGPCPGAPVPVRAVGEEACPHTQTN